MTSLPPVKKPLAALAQKSVARPSDIKGQASIRANDGHADISRKGSVGDGGPAFEPVSFAKVSSPGADSGVGVQATKAGVQSVKSPALSDEPQIFTLGSLSAMAGMLVSELEGQRSADASAHKKLSVAPHENSSEPKSRETKNAADETLVRGQRPGSKLNLSV